MELEEMQTLWKTDSQRLEKRIEVNEKSIQQMNMNKAVGSFDKLVKMSIMGRNMALIYGAISIASASLVIDRLELSIPIILAALAMFWSYRYHLVIEKPADYAQIPLVELQKWICKFRIHTASSAKYDISIFLFWALTLVPLYLDMLFKVSIYSNVQYIFSFLMLIVAIVIITQQGFKKLYVDYDVKLKESEQYLEEIIAFEKA